MPCNMNVLTVFVEHREFNGLGKVSLGESHVGTMTGEMGTGSAPGV